MKKAFIFFWLPFFLFGENLLDNTGVIVGEQVRIREGASTSAKIIKEVNTGEMGIILSHTNTPDKLNKKDSYGFYWYHIQLSDGTKGWVYGKFFFVKLSGEKNTESYKKLTQETFIDNKKQFNFYIAESPIIMVDEPEIQLDIPCFYSMNEKKIYPIYAKGLIIKQIPERKKISGNSYLFTLIHHPFGEKDDPNIGMDEKVISVEIDDAEGLSFIKMTIDSPTKKKKYILWLSQKKNYFEISDVKVIQ